MQTKQIIAASIVLGFCFLTIMALVTRILLNKHNKQPNHDMHLANGEHDNQLLHISTSWKRMFRPKQNMPKGRWVPSISGVIKAGDEGLFPSIIFANIHGYPGEPSLQVLYELFAEEMRSRPTTERSAYTGEVLKFLSSNKRVASGPKRVQSMSHRAPKRSTTEGSMKMHRKSLDASISERGFSRSMSVKRPAPTLVPVQNGLATPGTAVAAQTSWTDNGQIVELLHGSTAVQVTPAELAAIAILLGTPLDVEGVTDSEPSRKGIFGISMSRAVMKDGRHQITLQRHKRSISQMPVRGSGFSPLFAKHMAAGSLPYSQDEKVIHSILITAQTLKVVEEGCAMHLHSSKSNTAQTRFLAMLPSSRELSFQVASTSVQPIASNPLIDAISTMPFVGALVPLASMALIKTVRFVASGGMPPARLLQRLEGLVDKVNRHAPHLDLFGPLYEPHNAGLLYRERERLGRLATDAKPNDSIAEKASRMQRYTTLLERLMALVPGMGAQEVLETVQTATRRELERSYHDAVAAHEVARPRASSVVDSHACPKSDARGTRFSTPPHSRSSRSSDVSMVTVASPTSSAGFPPHNLGKQVEQILKSNLPLSVENVALVARLIIAAWTLSVEVVAWDEGEQGFRVPDLSKLPEKMVLC
jgi:hypothetical protein